MPLICLHTNPSSSLILLTKACFSLGISTAFCFMSCTKRVWSPFTANCSLVSSWDCSIHGTWLTAFRREASSNCSENFLAISFELVEVGSKAWENTLSASFKGSQICYWTALAESDSPPFFFFREGIFCLRSKTSASRAGHTTPPNMSACRDLVLSGSVFVKPFNSVIRSWNKSALAESRAEAPVEASSFYRPASTVMHEPTLLRSPSKILRSWVACSL